MASRKDYGQSTVRTQILDPDQGTCKDHNSSTKNPQHEVLEVLDGQLSTTENNVTHGMEVLSSSSSGSWMQRIGWFNNRQEIDGGDDGIYKEQPDSPKAVYHGGVMESGSSPKIRRNRSYLTHSSHPSSQGTKDSLYDFHESEWTPPDSSYGAAIPIAGCIPKHIRRAIEVTLIGLGVVGLVFLIVTLSIRVSEEVGRNRDVVDSNSEFDGGTGLGDDLEADVSAYDDYFDDAFARVDGNNGLDDDYFDGRDDDTHNYVYYDDYSRNADDYFKYGN
ncbi:hypothetical protein FisN_1Lh500 [Fistulifera solaris]|uniref:Uncharacterized protein n=1 Tax=Fistulifera solaris TaxID=1519565 RepID=A0A1Z5K1I6_FISSO|nr:hypothetical protein FisN_1Lh500 [Fistulifera solaris]|eukprot:GAX20022.1 hypothetical protein FisN_1Lh500 [Fistulifera solaris]